MAFDQKIPILVRLPEADRRSLATLELLEVQGVPLRELIRTLDTLGPAEVRRVEQSRTVTVYADLATGGLDGALADVREAVAANPPPETGLRLTLLVSGIVALIVGPFVSPVVMRMLLKKRFSDFRIVLIKEPGVPS